MFCVQSLPTMNHMEGFTVDLTALPLAVRKSVVETIRDENAAQLALAKVRQAKIAKLHRDAVEAGSTKDGFGPCTLAIDPYFVNYFRIKENNQLIMSDPDFAEWLKKQDEWFRVRPVGTRVQIGWTGPKKLKSRKVYA